MKRKVTISLQKHPVHPVHWGRCGSDHKDCTQSMCK